MQNTRGTCVHIPKLLSVFSPGGRRRAHSIFMRSPPFLAFSVVNKCFWVRGVGGEHPLSQCILHHFSHSKRPIMSILDTIQQSQKTRDMHACVPELFSVFGSRGVGGQHTLCGCILHRFSHSNQLITSIIGPIQR